MAQQPRQLGGVGGDAPGLLGGGSSLARRCLAPCGVWRGAAVSGYAAGGHRIGAGRGLHSRGIRWPMWQRGLFGPGFTVGAFSVGPVFFTGMPVRRRCVAGSLPRRGVRLLCAAADASLLPNVHSVSLRAPQGGFPSPGSALAGAFFGCGEGACSQSAAVCPESL